MINKLRTRHLATVWYFLEFFSSGSLLPTPPLIFSTSTPSQTTACSAVDFFAVFAVFTTALLFKFFMEVDRWKNLRKTEDSLLFLSPPTLKFLLPCTFLWSSLEQVSLMRLLLVVLVLPLSWTTPELPSFFSSLPSTTPPSMVFSFCLSTFPSSSTLPRLATCDVGRYAACGCCDLYEARCVTP